MKVLVLRRAPAAPAEPGLPLAARTLRLAATPPHFRRADDGAEVDSAAVVDHIFEADVVVVA